MSLIPTVSGIQAEFLKTLQTLFQRVEELEYFAAPNLTKNVYSRAEEIRSQEMLSVDNVVNLVIMQGGVPPITVLRQHREKLVQQITMPQKTKHTTRSQLCI